MMSTPAKARNRKYDIDKEMKAYLSVEANRARYEEARALVMQRQAKQKLSSGWERRILMDLMFPGPVTAPTIKRAPETDSGGLYKSYGVPENFVLPFKATGNFITAGIFERTLRAQQGRCYLCDLSFTKMNPPTRDHVVPRSRGGKDGSNILAAHKSCNGAKGDRMPTEREAAYLKVILDRLRDSHRSRSTRRVG